MRAGPTPLFTRATISPIMTTDDSGKERRLDDRLTPQELGLAVDLKSLIPGRRNLTGELINISSGGMAVWLSKPLEAGSHWFLTVPEIANSGVPVKMLRARPGFGGHIHGFKFSSPQALLADRLARLTRRKPGKASKA